MRYDRANDIPATEVPECLGPDGSKGNVPRCEWTIRATFDDLLDTFGPPTGGNGYSVSMLWRVRFYTANGPVIVYVYDNARDRCPAHSVREWRVGSRHSTASELVADALDANRERRSLIAGLTFPTFPTI